MLTPTGSAQGVREVSVEQFLVRRIRLSSYVIKVTKIIGRLFAVVKLLYCYHLLKSRHLYSR